VVRERDELLVGARICQPIEGESTGKLSIEEIRQGEPEAFHVGVGHVLQSE